MDQSVDNLNLSISYCKKNLSLSSIIRLILTKPKENQKLLHSFILSPFLICGLLFQADFALCQQSSFKTPQASSKKTLKEKIAQICSKDPYEQTEAKGICVECDDDIEAQSGSVKNVSQILNEMEKSGIDTNQDFKERLQKRIMGHIQIKIARTEILQTCLEKSNKKKQSWFKKRYPQMDWPSVAGSCKQEKEYFDYFVQTTWNDMRISLVLAQTDSYQVVSGLPHLSRTLKHEVSDFGSLSKLNQKERKEAKKRVLDHLSESSLEDSIFEEVKSNFDKKKTLRQTGTRHLSQIKSAMGDFLKDNQERYHTILGELPIMGYMKTGNPNNKKDVNQAFSQYSGHLDDLLKRVSKEDVDMGLLLQFEPLVEELLWENSKYCETAEKARVLAEKDEKYKKRGLLLLGVTMALPCFMSSGAVCLLAGLAGGGAFYSTAKGEAKQTLERFLTGSELETVATLAEKDKEAFWELMLLPMAAWGTTAGTIKTAKQFVKKGTLKGVFKKNKPTVLEGEPPKNPFSLEVSFDDKKTFREAYNKGKFTEDEIYIDFLFHTRETLSAKIVGLKEDTVIADIFHSSSGRVVRRELTESELEMAGTSFLSKLKFDRMDNSLETVDAIVIPKSLDESLLKAQGYRNVFARGVDDMHRLQTVGEGLRKANINPYRTDISTNIEKPEKHIEFIRAGMIEERKRFQESLIKIIEKGDDLDYHPEKKHLESLIKWSEESLEILENFAQEARQKVKEKKVTYAWWLHWNNRLSVLATEPSMRIRVAKAKYNSPQEEVEKISEINKNWWKTEKNLNKYLESQYFNDASYSLDEKSSVDYIDEAIYAFPKRVHLPTIDAYGIVAMNMSSGNRVFPSGLVNKHTWADGELKAPNEFHWHDLNDSTAKFERGGVIFDRKFNTHFREEVRKLGKEDREKVESVFFALGEIPGVVNVNSLTPENISKLMITTTDRFRNSRDLGALIPSHVNRTSEESVRAYLQEASEVFSRVSGRTLQNMNP